MATPSPTRTPPLIPRAWYSASIAKFLAADPCAVLGEVMGNSDLPDTPDQRLAWQAEIEILRAVLPGLSGQLHLEFTIPRVGHRADAVLIIGPAVFVLEFKIQVDATRPAIFTRAGFVQVWDYGLDLKHFHKASRNPPILPVLVVPAAEIPTLTDLTPGPDRVFHPQRANADNLRAVMDAFLTANPGMAIDVSQWDRAPYYPSPTIVEAACALYREHTVAQIAASEAGQEELDAAAEFLAGKAEEARATNRRYICFLTGVPGAGKTLVGLGLATQHPEPGKPHAVYMSGNGPLIEVLREALYRDEMQRYADHQNGRSRRPLRQTINNFIQSALEFRRDILTDPLPPAQHVAIFDEAQRAWTRAKLAAFMARRPRRTAINESEPELYIKAMDRHQDWAMIICLVGEGQEINQGEAGISEWLLALRQRFPGWQAFASPHLQTQSRVAELWQELASRDQITTAQSLHLSVSVRSARAERLSRFVQALLEGELSCAQTELRQFEQNYPIVLTRNLEAAKQWVRSRAEGSDRFGLLATSKALRLKPHAVDVRIKIDPPQWFLNDQNDTRSSLFLEDVATEFDVQGLELDWACVAWDGDLRYQCGNWVPFGVRHDARYGTRWHDVHNVWNQIYARNAYRVLLTRARKGMAICVPRGNSTDHTRSPEYYDGTYEYLRSLGLTELN